MAHPNQSGHQTWFGKRGKEDPETTKRFQESQRKQDADEQKQRELWLQKQLTQAQQKP